MGVTLVWVSKKSFCWGQSQIPPKSYPHNTLFFLFLVIYYLNKLQKCNYWQKSRRCICSVFFAIDPCCFFIIMCGKRGILTQKKNAWDLLVDKMRGRDFTLQAFCHQNANKIKRGPWSLVMQCKYDVAYWQILQMYYENPSISIIVHRVLTMSCLIYFFIECVWFWCSCYCRIQRYFSCIPSLLFSTFKPYCHKLQIIE